MVPNGYTIVAEQLIKNTAVVLSILTLAPLYLLLNHTKVTAKLIPQNKLS